MSKSRNPDAFLRRLWALEKTLIAAGFPAMPAWWRATIERHQRSGKRALVVRKGRRVFASTCVAPRLAVAEMLFGEHPHLSGTPPHTFAFLSVKRGEAANRLRGVRAILDVLGEAYAEKGETIELTGRPAIFAVLTANYRLSVGETVAFAWCDELARWRDDDAGANPAEQVIGSLTPALATLPDARLYLVSSPLGLEDYHSKRFDLGETAGQCIAFGATWEINPTLTRERCQELEPDPKLFAREYGAIPSASASPAFETDHVLRCFRPLPEGCRFYPSIGSLDSAAGRSARADSMAWGVAGYALPPEPEPYLMGMVPRRISTSNISKEALAAIAPNAVWNDGPITFDNPNDLIFSVVRDANGEAKPNPNPELARPRPPLLVVHGIDSVQGVFQQELVSGGLWDRIGRYFRDFGVASVVGDRYGEPQSMRELRRWRQSFVGLDWTNDSKVRAVYRLRQLMADNALILPAHARLKAELLGYHEKISPSGSVTYAARGSGKDDHVAVLINAVIAEELRKLPGSDLYAPSIRHETPGRG